MGLKAALMASGVWEDVRARVEQDAPDDLADFNIADVSGWVPLSSHVRVVNAATDVLGIDGMRALGRARILSVTMGGVFPNMVRSWLRAFVEPHQLVQIGPHIWRASTEDCGTLSLISLEGTSARFRFDHIPLLMRESGGWRAMMEGIALGVLELAGIKATIELTPPREQDDFADAWVSWAS